MRIFDNKNRRLAVGILAFALLIIAFWNFVSDYLRYGNPPERFKTLTKDEYIEDFDCCWETLEDNFPLFDVALRKTGKNYEDIRDKYRACLIEKDIDYYGFYTLMTGMLGELEGVGHLSMANPQAYIRMRESVEYLGDNNTAYVSTLYPFLDDEATNEAYGWLEKVTGGKATASSGSAGADDNVSFEEVDSSTSIIKIPSFDTGYIERDAEEIKSWLEAHEDDENLIVDIRSNQGGSGSYWTNNIVGPLISKPINYNTYYFIKNGSDYRDRLSKFAAEGTYEEAGKLPDMPELNKSDINGMLMGRTVVSVEPVDWGIDFDGKIFLLVNESVYSAADQFVSFCKDSGFATIVGSTTKGDGGGITPLWSQMPNTKLLFMYRLTYILNPDGSCNQETGVTPDIYTDGDALEACLELINGN